MAATLGEAPDRLRQASLQLVEALATGDLEAADRALAERAQAIVAGAPATEEIVALGEQAAVLLESLRCSIGIEASRLMRLQLLHSSTQADRQIDFQG